MDGIAQVLGIVVLGGGAFGAVGRLLIASFRVAKRAETAAAAPARLDVLEPIVAQNREHRETVTRSMRRIDAEVTKLREELRTWESVAGDWFESADDRFDTLEDLLRNGDEPDR